MPTEDRTVRAVAILRESYLEGVVDGVRQVASCALGALHVLPDSKRQERQRRQVEAEAFGYLLRERVPVEAILRVVREIFNREPTPEELARLLEVFGEWHYGRRSVCSDCGGGEGKEPGPDGGGEGLEPGPDGGDQAICGPCLHERLLSKYPGDVTPDGRP